MPTISRKARLLRDTISWASDTAASYRQHRAARLEDDAHLEELIWENRFPTSSDWESSDDDRDSSSNSSSSLSSLSSDSSADASDSESRIGHALFALDVMFNKHDEEADVLHFLELTNAFLSWLQNTRVIFPSSVPKSSQLHLVLTVFRDSDSGHTRFCRNLRVEPATFTALLERIAPDPIFYNNSNSPNSQLTGNWPSPSFGSGIMGIRPALHR